jgi:hypothetical protein
MRKTVKNGLENINSRQKHKRHKIPKRRHANVPEMGQKKCLKAKTLTTLSINSREKQW